MTDENWTLRVMPLLTHRMLYSVPELVMSMLNQTMRACPSTSAAATLTLFYIRVVSDPGITPRVMNALTFHELEFMTCIPRAWVGNQEKNAVEEWKRVHFEMQLHNIVWIAESVDVVEKPNENVPFEIREIWNRLPLLA